MPLSERDALVVEVMKQRLVRMKDEAEGGRKIAADEAMSKTLRGYGRAQEHLARHNAILLQSFIDELEAKAPAVAHEEATGWDGIK